MPHYNFLAGEKDGTLRRGEIEAKGLYQAAKQLRKQGLFVLSLKKKSQLGPIDLDKLRDSLEAKLGAELNSGELIMFTAHLASMLKAGVPIVEAISTFIDQKGRSRSRRMFEQIIADIESGLPLSQALSRFPKTFSPIYTHMASSGESTGTLGETLEYQAEQLRKDHQLVNRVKEAMIYPAVIVIIMIIVFGFVTFSVVPKLLTFAENIGKELPASTKLLIAITSFFTRFGLQFFLALVAIAFLLARLVKTKAGKEKFDWLLLSLPLFSSLIRQFNLVRFSRLLGAFYHYGVPIPTAFSIMAGALPNVYYQSAVNRLKDKMARGTSLSDALAAEEERGLFPKIMVNVIQSAEKSATVDDALWRLADYNQGELDTTLKGMTTIIEPVLILILGIAVTGLALAVIVPIYQITVSIQ